MVKLFANGYNQIVRKFYDGLDARGKKKMVALKAIIRKMIMVLNEKVGKPLINSIHYPINAMS